MGKRERQERKDAERQRRTERRRRRRREEAERKEREEIERLKRDRRGRADKIKKRKKERKGQDQEERVRERKNDAEKLRTTEGNEMLPCPRLPTDLLCLGTPEVKDIRIWMEQAKRMKLLLEKQAVEQKIRHESEKKERKGQGGNEKEEENQRREVAKKKSFVSSLKTRYLEHKREQIINSLFRTCQQEDAINAGDDAPEVKEIRKRRLLAHRRMLINKLDKTEEKINRRRDKGRKTKTQEEGDKEDEKNACTFSKVVTALFDRSVN